MLPTKLKLAFQHRCIVRPMDYIKKMEIDMRFAGLRDKTINKYVKNVANALQNIGKQPEEINAYDINEFLLQLYNRDAAGTTIIGYYASLKFFFRQTLKVDWKFERIPKLANFNRSQPRPVTRSEIKQILKATSKTVYRVMFALMYSSGLRVSEVCHLAITDLNKTDMLINVENGKGGVKRQTVLSKNVLKMVLEYQKTNPSRFWLFPARSYTYDSEFLFRMPEENKPIHVRSVQREFSLVCADLGLPGFVTLHSLRHSFATHLIEDGLSIFAIQKLLGHKNFSTTLKYLRYAQARPQNYFSPYDKF